MFSTVKPLTKYFYIKTVRIYDFVFTIHSKCTIVLLLISSALLSAKQYFGDPIECQGDTSNIMMVNTFCWTMGTFLWNSSSSQGLQSNFNKLGAGHKGAERVYFRYYQWVVLLLLLQALLFYLPAFLWKLWEGQRLSQICSSACDAVIPDDVFATRLQLLTKYFTTDSRRAHGKYMAKHVLCEIMNFLVSLLNIHILDIFFNGFWLEYIDALLAIPMNDWELWNTHSSKIFPKLTKCEFFRYGGSGSIERKDLLCLLPLNVLNEKIFAFFYIWFLFIAVLAALNLIYRFFTIVSHGFRLQVLRSKGHYYPLSNLRVVIDDFTLSDWFMLIKVAANINPILFKELLFEIYKAKRMVKNFGSSI